MKENFPGRAVIRIPDRETLEMLVQYCEVIGLQWGEFHPMRACLDFVGEYLKDHPKDTCLCFTSEEEDKAYFGYCYARYYESSHYLNKQDERWNFCSVEHFIEWTGGFIVGAEEDVDVDFATILQVETKSR